MMTSPSLLSFLYASKYGVTVHPKQLKIYKLKAAFLESKGWKTQYHYNYWVRSPEHEGNFNAFQTKGMTLEEACLSENYYRFSSETPCNLQK